MATLGSGSSPSTRHRLPLTSDSTDSLSSLDSSPSSPLLSPAKSANRPDRYGLEKKRGSWCALPTNPRARRSFGLLLLATVVFLWVSSNFLTFAIFSDDTYSKPYFVTYLNTSMFCLYLIPVGWKRWRRKRQEQRRGGRYQPLTTVDGDGDPNNEANADDELEELSVPGRLTVSATARLSLEFCLLWFLANYLSTYCLAFTSVASSTILSSTSGIFTLVFGAFLSHTRFSFPKLAAVVLSLLGISLISNIDLHPTPSTTPASSRTPYQILLGDLMALLSAFAYAAYITLLKHRVGEDHRRVDMQLFFSFVGAFNALFLWPGLILLHYSGIEHFQLPPDGRVWAIVGVNASITLVSDMCWALAMLLTSPLVVTVGLGATIPVAMVGEMVVLGVVAGVWYWVGAGCVLAGFVVVNWEEEREEKEKEKKRLGEVGGDEDEAEVRGEV